MPQVKIDLIKNRRTPEQIKKLADTVQHVLITTFNAPIRDRYQIITQHEPYEMICEDTGLGIERTDDLVFIEVLQQGRDADQKRALFAGLAEKLKSECGLQGSDLIVSIASNTREDWSFGYGRAQFVVGDL